MGIVMIICDWDVGAKKSEQKMNLWEARKSLGGKVGFVQTSMGLFLLETKKNNQDYVVSNYFLQRLKWK